jgi:hypothetical protein
MGRSGRRALAALAGSALLLLPAGASATGTGTLTFQGKASAKSLTVTIKSSQAGTATVTGPGLRKTVKALATGTHKVTVALTKTGEAERKAGKTIKVTVSLKIGTKTASVTEKIKL